MGGRGAHTGFSFEGVLTELNVIVPLSLSPPSLHPSSLSRSPSPLSLTLHHTHTHTHTPGDMLLALGGKPVTCFRDIESLIAAYNQPSTSSDGADGMDVDGEGAQTKKGPAGRKRGRGAGGGTPARKRGGAACIKYANIYTDIINI